ncbi:DUF5133 domain-containing protein, partial [Streptomyces sp. SID3212]|uniref:DUF5133 domain-containing protein n=1 Tax=unclassified Streptomyces TaxID=2593676 RepID=UPI0019252D52
MAHPAILRNLVERYEELQVAGTAKDSLENRRRLEDVTYTLCVSTGTRTIEDALRVAEEQLSAALDPAEADVRLTA